MRKGLVYSLLLYLSCTSVLRASAPFTDLDFESPTPIAFPGPPGGSVYFDAALPGWIGFSGTNQLDWVLYDVSFLDSTGIAILDANSSSFVLGARVIQGNYSVLLEAGVQLGSSTIPADVSLSQTGLVPAGTKSLTFLAQPNDLPAASSFTVSLGGVNLNLISSAVTNETYSLYEADVSAFAGQTAELKFTLSAQNPYTGQLHTLTLDDIQFSPNSIPGPIPEPGALSLLAIGVVALGIWRLTRPKAA